MSILAKPGCTGCMACVAACRERHSYPGGLGAIFPRFQEKGEDPDRWHWKVSVCLQCANPRCATACPTGALTLGVKGVIWHSDLCVYCHKCESACPVQVLRITADHIIRCDTCGGKVPGCVSACPLGLLTLKMPREGDLK